MSNPLIFLGMDGLHGPEIARWLGQSHEIVGNSGLAAAGLVVNTLRQEPELAFGEIDDARFESACIDAPLACISMLQSALPQLKRPGSVVFLASDAHLGVWRGAHRAAEAAALIGIARSLALEFGAGGLSVNTVAAGAKATPEGIAAAAAYLLSPAAASVSGQIVLVDGGDSLKMRNARRRD